MQFMYATGKRFGLGPDGTGFDTRFDPRAAAEGSASYLNERMGELNRSIELLSANQPAFGILSHDRSIENARSLARSGLDFVIIDMEHGPLDFESLRTFLLGMVDKARILEKGNLQMDVAPLVRLPANGRDQATFLTKQALDVGRMLPDGR